MSGYGDAYAKLEGYWPLQETSGSVAGDAIGSNDGAMEGGLDPASHSVAGPTGWLPNALRFDGVSRLVRIPYAPALFDEQQYTMAGWVRWNDPSSVIEAPFGALNLADMSGSFASKNGDGDWAHTHGTGASPVHDVDGAATPDVWRHLAIVRDAAGDKHLYLDGVRAAGPTASVFVGNTNAPFTIGGLDLGFGPFYLLDGDVAGVGLATVGLSSSEVAELFAGPEPTNVELPSLSGAAVAGECIALTPGMWDDHGNGSQSTTHALQQSEDGVGGWATAAGSEDALEFDIPLGLAGKYVRVRAVASNDGGKSDAAQSGAVRVEAPRRPLRVEAATRAVHGALCGQASSSGAATGVALTY